MKRIEHMAGLFFLVAALCFAFSVGTVSASSDQPAAEGSHAAAVGQAGAADSAHSAGGDVSHAEEGGHGAAGGSLSGEKLKDLFWRVLNFIVLMIILVKFGAKPIGSALAGRRQRIRDELSDLEARKAAAEKSYRAFEAKLAGVEKDIDGIVEKAIAQAEVEKQKIIEKAEKAADDIKRQAELTIQNEIMEARRTLKNDAAEQAAVMARELIVKNLTPDDQVKIIEDYLDKVGAVQ